jgi:predicted MPP superfamily phosphohydrolase
MQVYVLLGIVIISIFSYILYRAFLNTKQVVINRVHLSGALKPDERHLLSVLHISDMHLEHLSISPELLFELLSKEHIDVIALTGDYLDRKASISKLSPYLDVFNKLAPKYGIYAVFGNHDYVLRHPYFAKLKSLFESYGCKILQNENDSFYVHGKQINIIGIDDFSTNRSDLSQSFRDIKEGFNLVLTHDPNIILDMELYNFHYLLAGHFHGGQIHWPKPYHLKKMGKLIRMNIVKGLHSYQGKPFYISEGLGQTGINIRIGSRPEITIHHLTLQTIEDKKTLRAV